MSLMLLPPPILLLLPGRVDDEADENGVEDAAKRPTIAESN